VGAGGRLQLYLVNSGPDTSFYNESVPTDGNCSPITKPGSLSTKPGTSAQFDSPGYAFGTETPSTLSYTVPAGGGFTVPANPNAVILKLWAYSGDGTCTGQDGAQAVDWRAYCSGSCGSEVSLTGPGQTGDKAGFQKLDVPAGAKTSTLFNEHTGPTSAVKVSAGDVIPLILSADTWAGINWSAPNGKGVSLLSIEQR
jgi:hypothetical protein